MGRKGRLRWMKRGGYSISRGKRDYVTITALTLNARTLHWRLWNPTTLLKCVPPSIGDTFLILYFD